MHTTSVYCRGHRWLCSFSLISATFLIDVFAFVSVFILKQDFILNTEDAFFERRAKEVTSQAGVTDIHDAWCLLWVLGIWIRFSCLHKKHITHDPPSLPIISTLLISLGNPAGWWLQVPLSTSVMCIPECLRAWFCLPPTCNAKQKNDQRGATLTATERKC